MKNKLFLTYQDYLLALTQNPQRNASDYGQYLQETQKQDPYIELSSTLIFLLDFSSKTYPILGSNIKQVMGHPRGSFMEGGLEFMLDQYKDFDVLNKKVFPDELEIMKNIGADELSQFRFSKSYRFKNEKGEYRTILQRNSMICTKDQILPVAIFGFAWDITPFTEKGKIIHQVEKYASETKTWSLVFSKEYYPEIDQNQLLSNREIEILKWSMEGYSSKQIADKLFIAFNTVNTHRRNMLRKTNCANSMELLRYAIENKLL